MDLCESIPNGYKMDTACCLSLPYRLRQSVQLVSYLSQPWWTGCHHWSLCNSSPSVLLLHIIRQEVTLVSDKWPVTFLCAELEQAATVLGVGQ